MKSAAPGIQKLLDGLPPAYSPADRELVERAYVAAEQAHHHQKRSSGEPYINHCLAVARILADLHAQPDVIAAGLLHDTVEDTSMSLEEIRRSFGDTIASLVDGVTKLTQLPRVSRGDRAEDNGEPPAPRAALGRKPDLVSETLRKTFLAMDDDVRVVLIKLADRLHNMRTLGFLPESKRKRIAQQTLDIFAPLANRLGIWQIKWELEDLAFRHVNPEKYKEIADQLAERRNDRETQVAAIVEKLQELLAQHGMRAEVSGRPKHIYSIYRKMVDKGKPFEMVRDVRGVRLIVPDVPSCYAVLGLIHTRWRPIQGEFDDYIAAPKDNYYQSLHTSVIYEDRKPLEVQIRTAEMHQNAELGIAAHWRYKEETPRDPLFDRRVKDLRRMMEWRQDVDDAQEFVDGMKSDVFGDRVYVFTPRGDIIDMPAGVTPIDFAYHVHTDIGHRCRGARVNGKLVSLDHILATGDRVEILTAKRGGPSRDWLNPNLGLVKTQRARSKIRLWFKKQDYQQNLTQGRELLERELARLGIPELNFETLAHDLELRNAEEMFVALGCGDLSLSRVVRELSHRDDNDELLPSGPLPGDLGPTDAVQVVGLKGLLTSMGRCCNPTPGDDIIGYITRGRGATVHRQDCPNILRLRDRERLVRVSWGEQVRTYPVPIEIAAYDRQGLMNDITTLLNAEGVNILNVTVRVSRNIAHIRLHIEVRDIQQLSRLLTRIESLPNVMEAVRIQPG